MTASRSEDLVKAAAQLCSEDLPLEQSFEGFCGLLSQSMPVPVGVLMARVPEGLHVVAYYRQDELVKPDTTLIPATSVSASVVRTKRSKLIVNRQDWPARAQQFTFGGEGVATGSAIFVPLLADDTAVGVLTVQALVSGAYRQSDVDLLERCAPCFAQRVRAEFSGRFE
jgi:transcriptional regulator with GAF, ATPase, and Fis domain